MDQYLHAASFVLSPKDSAIEGKHYRLYGFTDTLDNDDSRWHEGLTSQTDSLWPDRYWGANQYPSGAGVLHLETKVGPAPEGLMTYNAANTLAYARWGVNRNTGFGYHPTNGDGRITLLVAREEDSTAINDFYSRQYTGPTTNRPRLVLDVRFPEIQVGLGTNTNLLTGATYDFGVVQEPNGPLSTNLSIFNIGETLSSLHVTSVMITGIHTSAFALVAPFGTNLYVSQGTSSNLQVVLNPIVVDIQSYSAGTRSPMRMDE